VVVDDHGRGAGRNRVFCLLSERQLATLHQRDAAMYASGGELLWPADASVDDWTRDRAFAGATECVGANRAATVVDPRRPEGARVEGELLDTDVVAIARKLVVEIARCLHFRGGAGDAGADADGELANVVEDT